MKIFESPDKGATVYARDFGAAHKTLVPNASRCNASVSTIFGLPISEVTPLVQMHIESKSNPALQAALERAKIIYLLSKETNGNSET